MKTLKVTEHFYLHEFLPEDLYKNLRTLERGLELLDIRILLAIEALRVQLNRPVYVNNWKEGGKFGLRGLRPFNTSVGSSLSQHKFGRALDLNVIGMSCDEVREYIIKMIAEFTDSDLKYITTMEMETPDTNLEWVHIDCRNVKRTDNSKLYYVYPR